MSVRRVAIASVVVAVLSATGVAAQSAVDGNSKQAAQPRKGSTLTPQDYIEIQQLVARYPYALDGGLGNGKAYADLFTEDGEFRTSGGRVYSGRKELLTIAARGVETPNALAHFIVNHIIEPTAEGAVGKEYLLLIIPLGEVRNGRPIAAVSPFHYEDVYRKTPAGWRFKSRKTFSREERPAAPQASK